VDPPDLERPLLHLSLHERVNLHKSSEVLQSPCHSAEQAKDPPTSRRVESASIASCVYRLTPQVDGLIVFLFPRPHP